MPPKTVSPITVPAELSGKPLDAAVRQLFGASWGKARAWIETGKVRIDGEVVTEPLERVREGSAVVVLMNAPRPRRENDLSPESIVHVDAHVVVVNKPSGISTVPYKEAGGAEEDRAGTLDELVRNHLMKRSRGKQPPALGVVHRIDKETSGLVVFTRTWLAKKSLAAQFRAHTVHRRYLALAHGAVGKRTFRTHLVENRGDGLRGSSRGGTPDAQLAITHVEPVEGLRGATLVACRLETGRTHQIRIHLSESGHPIVGDRVYTRGFAGELIAAPRLMLHAAELGFEHPQSGEPVRFEVDPPPDFRGMVARLRRK